MASAGQAKLSREEYKKQKELEEARKAGRAAPAIDDEGNMINPHIPQVCLLFQHRMCVLAGMAMVCLSAYKPFIAHSPPHPPQYISQAPWYLNQTSQGLKHQKVQQKKETVGLDVWCAGMLHMSFVE